MFNTRMLNAAYGRNQSPGVAAGAKRAVYKPLNNMRARREELTA